MHYKNETIDNALFHKNVTHDFPPQEYFLYKGRWDESKVDFLLDFILKDLARHPEERVACTPIGTLHHGRIAVNERFEMNFSWDEICDHFNMMKNKYTTFTQILRAPGVCWIQLTNHVDVSDELWHHICEVLYDYIF